MDIFLDSFSHFPFCGSLSQEEVAKGMLAEFNLGCDVHKTEHVYRVYVTTFLGYGGNAARTRYEKALVNATVTGMKR